MKAAFSNNRGFTLLEVLVALLFISLLFQPVGRALWLSAVTSRQYRSQLTSLAEMQAQMETTLSDLAADRWHPEEGWSSDTLLLPESGEEPFQEPAPGAVTLSLMYQELSLVEITVHSGDNGPSGLPSLRTIRHTGIPPWRQEKRTPVPVS